jgi:hypothetical protein
VRVPEAKRSAAAPEAPPTLRHDGVRQILTFSTATAGDWHLALELEQLGDGELVGVGTLSAAALVTAAERGFELVVGGRANRQGLATLELTPVVDDGGGPLTLLVRLTVPRDGADPTVASVLAVKGRISGRRAACAMSDG